MVGLAMVRMQLGATRNLLTLASPPGPNTLAAIWGIASNFGPWNYMVQMRREGYDKVADVNLGPAGSFTFLMSADAVQEVAVAKTDAFARRFSLSLFETLGIDRGIVYEQGKRHLRNKKLCMPSFQNAWSLETFYGAVHTEFDNMQKRWDARIEENGGSADFDLYAEMRRFTLDIIVRVTFGVGLEEDTGLYERKFQYHREGELSFYIRKYLEEIVALSNEVSLLQVYPRLSSHYVEVVDHLLPTLRGLVDDVIATRRREVTLAPTKDANYRADLLSALVQDDAITDEEISEILFDVIIAGSDTTASTLGSAIYILHEQRHKPLLDRAVAEAQRIDARQCNRSEAQSKMPYTYSVVREALRLYPPVPFVARTSVKDAEVCGYHVKAGSTACISPWYLGRDPFAWGDNSEEFVPERWLQNPTTGGAPTIHQWLPFGAGIRGCMGSRLALVESIVGISQMLRYYQFEFERKGELSFSYDITLNLEGSTLCTIRKRDRATLERVTKESDADTAREAAALLGQAVEDVAGSIPTNSDEVPAALSSEKKRCPFSG